MEYYSHKKNRPFLQHMLSICFWEGTHSTNDFTEDCLDLYFICWGTGTFGYFSFWTLLDLEALEEVHVETLELETLSLDGNDFNERGVTDIVKLEVEVEADCSSELLSVSVTDNLDISE